MEINFSSSKNLELINITHKVNENLVLKEGLVHLFAPHATGVLLIAEDEEGLKLDILKKFKQMFPKGAGYLHDRIDDNAHSHLMSTFLGSSLLLPVKNKKLNLGTWQEIFFLETDGPRSGRRIILTEI